VIYVVAMVGVVVAVDVLFFEGHVWERLAANVGIVLVFVAFYFGFLHRRAIRKRREHELRGGPPAPSPGRRA
jgi:uncharacterized membrane protein